MEKLLTCIGCPMGCQITVTMENGEVASIKGNTCKKGAEYARDEVTCPTRMVTSVLAVEGAKEPLCVKTAKFIPKDKMFDCLKEIREAKVSLPVEIGDVVVPNVCGTGIDVIATRHLE